VKILLADDHVPFRAALAHALRQLDPGVRIVEAGNCEQVRAAIPINPDLSLILLDLHMPDGDGSTALDSLRRYHPGIGIVALSASEGHSDMQQALRKGALGFIPKAVAPAVTLSALKLVLAGGICVHPRMFGETTAAVGNEAPHELSPRQLEVLARAVEGKPYKIIARELGLAEPTVKTHLIAAFRTLGVNNRLQAARKVQELKLRLSKF
jgi:DNA-binding NarL/FixJ family response regulator